MGGGGIVDILCWYFRGIVEVLWSPQDLHSTPLIQCGGILEVLSRYCVLLANKLET